MFTSLRSRTAMVDRPLTRESGTDVIFTKNKLYIGGHWVEPESGQTMTVLNPATEEVVDTAPVASAKDAANAVYAARVAFDDGPWARMPGAQRGEHIRRFGQALERNRSALAALTTAEAGISS